MASLYKKPVFIRDPKTGERVKTKSKKWWGRLRDADGREKRVPLACDKAAAQRMLTELVLREERKSAGIIDRFDDHASRPLTQHLADYRRYLQSKGDSPGHVAKTESHITKILTGCRFTTVRDLSASRVAHWLTDLRAKGRSPRTSNSYLTAIKGFSKWLVRDRRASEDVLLHMSHLNTKVDLRRQRRTLTADETARLIAAAATGEKYRGLSGPDRTVLYQVALNTGLRVGELASLTAQSFDLDAEPPTVAVEAAYSKHRRRDVLPIRADLVTVIRDYLRRRKPINGERLWSGTWSDWGAAKMVRSDLASARERWVKEAKTPTERARRQESKFLEYRDGDGRVFDFHALRHQFISNLARGGAHPKEAQALARHSTITLTMDRYTHLGIMDLTAALERLPAIQDGDGQINRGRGAVV